MSFSTWISSCARKISLTPRNSSAQEGYQSAADDAPEQRATFPKTVNSPSTVPAQDSASTFTRSSPRSASRSRSPTTISGRICRHYRYRDSELRPSPGTTSRSFSPSMEPKSAGVRSNGSAISPLSPSDAPSSTGNNCSTRPPGVTALAICSWPHRLPTPSASRPRQLCWPPPGRTPCARAHSHRTLHGLVCGQPENDLSIFMYSLRGQERLRDKLRLTARLLTTLTESDFRAVRIPSGLRWLYYPIRPFRIAAKALAQALARLRSVTAPPGTSQPHRSEAASPQSRIRHTRVRERRKLRGRRAAVRYSRSLVGSRSAAIPALSKISRA